MKKYTPTLMVLSALIGVFIGTYFADKKQSTFILPSEINRANKVDELMELVHRCYVDSLEMNDIIEKTMPKILTELDPHSTYIPAKDLEATNADLKSSFSGIGIRFLIEEDTIHISDIIRGGPSEQVGLMPGDRIITINDTLFVGKVCTNEAAMSKLKGPGGTKVPQGTAGMPVLDIIRKRGCTDTVIVVTRYFGGTLLGTGGLVHAYTSAALGALEAAEIIRYDVYAKVSIKVNYSDYGKISASLSELGFRTEDTIYDADVSIIGSIIKGRVDELEDNLTEITSGRADFKVLGEEFSY